VATVQVLLCKAKMLRQTPLLVCLRHQYGYGLCIKTDQNS
jgi:hypothetical protein